MNPSIPRVRWRLTLALGLAASLVLVGVVPGSAGKVGWNFRIEYSNNGTDWTEYTNSPIVARSATDKVNAHFKSRTWPRAISVKTNYWRAINKFYWFYPDVNTVSGGATLG